MRPIASLKMRGTISRVATPHPTKANTKLYTYGKGTDGGQLIADHSPALRDLTAVGNAQLDTGISMQGTSFLFDGTGDYITMADSADFAVGNATDFCIEALVRVTAIGSPQTIFSTRGSAPAGGFWLYVNSAGKLVFETVTSANASAGSAVSSGTLTANTTYHVVGSREGSTLRVFIDGVLAGSGTQSGTAADPTGARVLKTIGIDNPANTLPITGSINHVRFTKGEAVYTASFVPVATWPMLYSGGATAPDVTLNPYDTDSSITVTGGHLTATKGTSDALKSIRATKGINIATQSGYFEVYVSSGALSTFMMVGIGKSTAALTNYVGSDANGWGYYQDDGHKYTAGADAGAMGAAWKTNGDIVQVAVKNGKVWFGKNNTWNGDPAAGTGEAFSGITGTVYPMLSLYRGAGAPFHILGARFSTDHFTYSPPSGFNSWDLA